MTGQRDARTSGSTVAAPAPVRMPHLRGLDGIRALAVAGVVVYHLGAPWMRGGFLGVDVFFVLSGYLITTLILDEVERTGRFSFRQLLRSAAPAGCCPRSASCCSPWPASGSSCASEAGELRGDIVAAAGYVVELVADRRRPLLLRAGQPAAAAAAPVVAGDRGAVLPGVPAGRAPRDPVPGRARVGQLAAVLAIASTVAMARHRDPHVQPRPARPQPRLLRHGHPLDGAAGGCGDGVGVDAVADLAPGRLVGARARAGRAPVRGGRHGRPRRARAARGRRGLRLGRRVQRGALPRRVPRVLGAWPRSSSARSPTPPGCSAASSAASRCAGWASGRTGSTCGTGPCSCSAARASTSRPRRGSRRPLRLAVVLALAELSYRFVELPVRRGALGRASRSARRGGARRRRSGARRSARPQRPLVVGGDRRRRARAGADRDRPPGTRVQPGRARCAAATWRRRDTPSPVDDRRSPPTPRPRSRPRPRRRRRPRSPSPRRLHRPTRSAAPRRSATP